MSELTVDILRTNVAEWNRLRREGTAMPSLNGASLYGASLNRASLNGASLNGASLYGASLNRASLNGASLHGASLNRASLNRASLKRASLNRASLNGASLNGALVVAGLDPLPDGAFTREHEVCGYRVRYWHAADGTVLYLWAGCRRGTPDEVVESGEADSRSWVPLLKQSIALAEASARWETSDES